MSRHNKKITRAEARAINRRVKENVKSFMDHAQSAPFKEKWNICWLIMFGKKK